MFVISYSLKDPKIAISKIISKVGKDVDRVRESTAYVKETKTHRKYDIEF